MQVIKTRTIISLREREERNQGGVAKLLAEPVNVKIRQES